MQAMIAKSLAYGETRLPSTIRKMSWRMATLIAFFLFGLLITEQLDEDSYDAPADDTPPVATAPPPEPSSQQQSLREVIDIDAIDLGNRLRNSLSAMGM